MINIFEFCANCCSNCSHDLHLYIVLAVVLCFSVALRVAYLLVSQILRYIQELLLLVFCRRK